MQIFRYVILSTKNDFQFVIGLALACFLLIFTISTGYLYLKSLEIIGMEDVVHRLGNSRSNIQVNSNWIPLQTNELSDISKSLNDAVDDQMGSLIKTRSTRMKSGPHFWGFSKNTQDVMPSASRAHFQELDGFGNHVDFIQGIPPSASISKNGEVVTVEAAIYVGRSSFRQKDKLVELTSGDLLSVTPEISKFGELQVKITGIFTEQDRNDEYWLDSIETILAPTPPQEFAGREPPLMLFVGSGMMLKGLSSLNAGLPINFTEILFFDKEKLILQRPSDLVNKFSKFERRVNLILPRSSVMIGPEARVKKNQSRMVMLTLPSLLIGSIALSVIVYYLLMILDLMIRKNTSQNIMLRNRGMSTKTIIILKCCELIPVVVIPSIVGILFAMIFVNVIDSLPVMKSILHGRNLSVPFYYEIVWFLGYFLVAFFSVFIAVMYKALHLGTVTYMNQRPNTRPFFQKYFVDIFVIIFGVIIWWEMDSRVLLNFKNTGDLTLDPVLLISPAIFIIVCTFILLRIFSIFAASLLYFWSNRMPVPEIIALYRLSRNSFWYSWPMILIMLTTGLTVVAGSLTYTLRQSSYEQILYDNGSSIRIISTRPNTGITFENIKSIEAINGVKSFSTALRLSGKIGTTGSGINFDLLGIQPTQFAGISWFRDDFSEYSLPQLMSKISVSSIPTSIELPLMSTKIGAWTKQDPYVEDHFFWIVLRDANDRQFTVTLGQIPEEWTYLETDIPETATHPIEIVSLQTYMQVSLDGGYPTTWFIDDVLVKKNNEQSPVIDFEKEELWTGLPTSNGIDVFFTTIHEKEQVGFKGNTIGKIHLDKGTDTGIRGIYRTFTGGFIPVLTSQNFSDTTGINGDDIFVAEVNGGYVPLKPVGTTQYFPTMNPNRSPFVILDVDAVLDFIELRGLTYSSPNEIFVDIDHTKRPNILSNINDVFKSDRIMDQEQRLDGLSIDPLTVAGWNVMSQIALWIGISTLVLAYVSFMKTHTKEMLKESTLFNSIGVGKIRRTRILLMENLVIVVFGVLGGVVSGLFTSIITLNSVTRSYFGEKLLPPYILQIDWIPLVFVLIFISAIILVFVLFAVIRDTTVINISKLYSRN
jgi:hypothetical protein